MGSRILYKATFSLSLSLSLSHSFSYASLLCNWENGSGVEAIWVEHGDNLAWWIINNISCNPHLTILKTHPLKPRPCLTSCFTSFVNRLFFLKKEDHYITVWMLNWNCEIYGVRIWGFRFLNNNQYLLCAKYFFFCFFLLITAVKICIFSCCTRGYIANLYFHVLYKRLYC